MSRAPTLAAILLFCATPALAQRGEDLVQPSLVAERTVARPGEELWIGVRLRIAPEWHLYWRNPGDSGVPPELELTLPEGLEAVDGWCWPAPERLVLDGGLLNYVHEGELTVLRRVRLSEALEPGATLSLQVAATWLVCKEVCVPGEGSASLTLRVGAESVPADVAAIETTRARVPRPPAGDLPLRVGWEGGTLVLELEGATALTYFPLTPELPVPEGMLARGHVAGARLEVVYPEPQPAVSGVLVAALGDEIHYLAVEYPAAD